MHLNCSIKYNSVWRVSKLCPDTAPNTPDGFPRMTSSTREDIDLQKEKLYIMEHHMREPPSMNNVHTAMSLTMNHFNKLTPRGRDRLYSYGSPRNIITEELIVQDSPGQLETDIILYKRIPGDMLSDSRDTPANSYCRRRTPTSCQYCDVLGPAACSRCLCKLNRHIAKEIISSPKYPDTGSTLQDFVAPRMARLMTKGAGYVKRSQKTILSSCAVQDRPKGILKLPAVTEHTYTSVSYELNTPRMRTSSDYVTAV